VKKILKVHIRKVPISSDVDIRAIARGTPGFSGADLANIVNEAALLAARRGLKLVSNAEFEDSKDKVMMGPERRSMVMSDEEKKLTAYHEAGHALVSLNYSSSDPIHKATIIPRGRALGMVMRLPERDQISITREKMFANLAVAMGGRIAEEEVFGYEKVTSGASSDIKQATQLARAMVMQYGMSDKLGFLAYGDNEEEVFLGRSVARTQNMSEETQKQVDAEVKIIVDKSYVDAEKIVKGKRKDLDIIANGLLDYETLTGDEIINLLKGIDPTRENPSDDDNGSTTLSGSVPKAGNKSSAKVEPGLQGT
jgi:cell division protease FtsH